MCGIVGIVDFASRHIPESLVEKMAELVSHRGPDGQAVWMKSGPGPTVAFGHRRLAVLDLSQCAAQPMHNSACVAASRATPLVLVFNGEIYNYRELRQQLIVRGHRLVSESDSEVILHLYEELGPACVSSLRGMFAFAVWDEHQERVFCARDRVGKKPLYYRWDRGRLWFPSRLVASGRTTSS